MSRLGQIPDVLFRVAGALFFALGTAAFAALLIAWFLGDVARPDAAGVWISICVSAVAAVGGLLAALGRLSFKGTMEPGGVRHTDAERRRARILVTGMIQLICGLIIVQLVLSHKAGTGSVLFLVAVMVVSLVVFWLRR